MEKIEIEAGVDVSGVSRKHRAWSLAEDELTSALAGETGVTVSRQDVQDAEGGTKGTVQELIIGVASSSGSMVAIARIFRLWLQRDRRRSLDIKIKSPGSPSVDIKITGETASTDLMREALSKAYELQLRNQDPRGHS